MPTAPSVREASAISVADAVLPDLTGNARFVDVRELDRMHTVTGTIMLSEARRSGCRRHRHYRIRQGVPPMKRVPIARRMLEIWPAGPLSR
jgi:hypothetical protein